MAKDNDKVPGTFVSQNELNELGQLLASFRDYILSHEARIELIEGWINEYHKHYSEGTQPAEEADGAENVEEQTLSTDAALAADSLEIESARESTDDSEER